MITTGSKVVCIKTAPNQLNQDLWHTPNGDIKKGELFVVSGFTDGVEGIGLILIDKPCLWRETGDETGWHPDYFRELEELKLENKVKELEKKLKESHSVA